MANILHDPTQLVETEQCEFGGSTGSENRGSIEAVKGRAKTGSYLAEVDVGLKFAATCQNVGKEDARHSIHGS